MRIMDSQLVFGENAMTDSKLYRVGDNKYTVDNICSLFSCEHMFFWSCPFFHKRIKIT